MLVVWSVGWKLFWTLDSYRKSFKWFILHTNDNLARKKMLFVKTLWGNITNRIQIFQKLWITIPFSHRQWKSCQNANKRKKFKGHSEVFILQVIFYTTVQTLRFLCTTTIDLWVFPVNHARPLRVSCILQLAFEDFFYTTVYIWVYSLHLRTSCILQSIYNIFLYITVDLRGHPVYYIRS